VFKIFNNNKEFNNSSSRVSSGFSKKIKNWTRIRINKDYNRVVKFSNK
jgi:hypothetical protein